MRCRFGAVCVAALLATTACYGQPERLCDNVFIAWGFDEHELTSADDVSGDPGLQIDVVLLSDLAEGTEGRLIVTDEAGAEHPHPDPASFDANGRMVFTAVDVPVGSIRFTLRTDNACRAIESNRTRFVIDELGEPACELSFSPVPRIIEGAGSLRSYIIDDDLDIALPGLQVEIGVFTSRAQMEVKLLALNRDTLTLDSSERTSGEDGTVLFPVTLTDGEQAVRALCSNGPADVTLSTATFEVLVDTVEPSCQIVSPTARVQASDDIDGNGANGVQVLVVGQTPDEDAIGLATELSINGAVTAGTEVGETGQTTAVLTVPVGGGDDQDFVLELDDVAGNRCTATASF